MEHIIALTREVSDSINNCELTHKARESIDVNLARQQHQHYQQKLTAMGCQIMNLPQEPDLPDAVFVEDTAVILGEIAIITRPGADSRRAETPSVAVALEQDLELAYIKEPGVLDGGDVLITGRHIYVGESTRSNFEGYRQLQSITSTFGYRVESVPLIGCLHLKSAVTQIRPDSLLVNPAWINPNIFAPLRTINVDESEPYAANALYIGESVLYPTAYPKTATKLKGFGINLISIDVSELIKAEGAVTCCSLIYKKALS